ncbi:seipin isoform X2 [Nilaparvata lugens]|uniref:seipin isoform X2 n=1 Tax=Nilaparvata lugens TaxID=108931 RepID=UPI00193CBE16|nr:seipin isoform X2 [Nilaparvata lugens]
MISIQLNKLLVTTGCCWSNVDTTRTSWPTAHVQLTKLQNILMVGQSYRIFLKLEMPESPANVKLGMFMVCADLADKDGVMVSNSCRSTMLHYRSQLLSILTTLTLSPFMVLGSSEEKQTIMLELYSHFEEDKNHPVTDVYLEIQALEIEFYSATLHIQAHLTGLRYLMFHWPLLSAALGVSSNLFFITFIAAVSWWHIYAPRDQYGNQMFFAGFGTQLFMGDLDYQPEDEYDYDELRTDESGSSRSKSQAQEKTPKFEERKTSRSMIMELRRATDE